MVSGEFGSPSAQPAATKADQAGDGQRDEDDAPSAAGDQTEDDDEDDDPSDEDDDPSDEDEDPSDEDDDPSGEDDEDDDPSDEDQRAAIITQPAANEPPRVSSNQAEPGGGGRSLVWIVGIAAAIVLAVVLVNRGSSPEPGSGSQSARPNKPDDSAPSDRADKPKPRPPQVKTHAADPKLAALREKQAREQAANNDEGNGDPDGERPEPPAAKPEVTDPRAIPPGTPEENAKAFAKLPVSVQDGPPIGAIGLNGIHIDEILMGAGRENTECNDPTRKFSTTGTEFVNVCIRVVHSRATDTLRVIWEKDGTVTRRGKVRIPDNLHAYKTRAYLQVRPEYVGSWRVRIVPEGEEDTDLAVAEFQIE
ncbi:Phage protein [Enhygromyxa salina]|uniref:Phage protein n=1 Tax=Enhygromyxa salina TaxID=215803 RepID=A0A0C2D0I4_9BACT|nr:Phage protein [Enhygromyxa salina]